MPNGNRKFFSAPDERSGPALLDREPVILPEQRKKLARRVREALNR